MTEKRHEVLDVEVAYQGYFRLDRWRVRHSLFTGGWSEEQSREVLERGHAAAVLPYDPLTDRVVLIEQFRAAAAPTTEPPWLLEVPAGIIDGGESPEETIRREAHEEAGLDLDRLTYVTRFLASPGALTEEVHVFVGRVDASAAGGLHGLDAEGEDIRVLTLDAADAIAMAQNGRIVAAHTVILLLWLALHRDELRRDWA
jgi:ADP-ribose pyrophosphatase